MPHFCSPKTVTTVGGKMYCPTLVELLCPSLSKSQAQHLTIYLSVPSEISIRHSPFLLNKFKEKQKWELMFSFCTIEYYSKSVRVKQT